MQQKPQVLFFQSNLIADPLHLDDFMLATFILLKVFNCKTQSSKNLPYIPPRIYVALMATSLCCPNPFTVDFYSENYGKWKTNPPN